MRAGDSGRLRVRLSGGAEVEVSRGAAPGLKARLGLGYGYEGIQRFVDVMGMANTADLFFSARIFGGADALQLGLVRQVVPVQDFDAVVDAYVNTIGENAPLTLAAAKRCLLELGKNPDQRDVARARAMIQACFASSDYKEGREAFAHGCRWDDQGIERVALAA